MSTIKNNLLTIGNEDAPLKLEAFINASCPGTGHLYEVSKDVFKEYIDKGQLQVIVKLWDKPREELLLGGLVHWSFDYSKPEETLDVLEKLLATQSEWLELSHKELKDLLVNEYHLEREERLENIDISLAITAEAIERGVKYVPTIFINGEQQPLTYKETSEDIRAFIENALEAVIL